MTWPGILGILAVLGLIGFVLHRTTHWAARRGWVYNKHNPRPPGRGIPLLFDELYEPAIEHVIEEQASEQSRADHAESGDKPFPEDRVG